MVIKVERLSWEDILAVICWLVSCKTIAALISGTILSDGFFSANPPGNPGNLFTSRYLHH